MTDVGLQPRYQEYRRQKCMLGYTEQADWADDLLDACREVLARPEFDLELDYARKHFEPGVPLRQKALELIANARCGIYDLSSWKDRDGVWRLPRNVLIELGMAIALNRPTILLRHTSNKEQPLPECLHNLSVLEFGGETTLKRELPTYLQQWIHRAPEQDWWSRHCHFGERVCAYREAHPRARQWGRPALHCHISDGREADRPDFRGVIEDVLDRFADVSYRYLDALQPDAEYSFLLCSHCQAVRSTPFAIYRISPETPAETYIAIGISLALEAQFEYPIPRILLTEDAGQIPSLLGGYEVIVARSDRERKQQLRAFMPGLLLKVREAAWKPRPLPFIDLARPAPEPAQVAPATAEELARRADALYVSLEPEEQAAAQQIFLRMIKIGEGATFAPAIVQREDLRTAGDSERMARMVEKLIQAGLLRVSDDTSENQTIGLADPTLADVWLRLHEWVEEVQRLRLHLDGQRRRLRVLQERRARYSAGETPPDLVVEIEGLQQEIASLEGMVQATDPTAYSIYQEEEVEHQKKLLETYRRALRQYLVRRAQLGTDNVPSDIMLGIAEAGEQIQRIKLILRAWGVVVDDHPDDEDPDDSKRSQQLHEYDAFISYDDSDAEWVENTLVPYLERAGLRVCLPNRDFLVGIPRVTNTVDSIKSSRRTLLIMTPDWVASDLARFEMTLALTDNETNQQWRVLPIKLRDCQLPLELEILEILDLTDPSQVESQMQRLLSALQADR